VQIMRLDQRQGSWRAHNSNTHIRWFNPATQKSEACPGKSNKDGQGGGGRGGKRKATETLGGAQSKHKRVATSNGVKTISAIWAGGGGASSSNPPPPPPPPLPPLRWWWEQFTGGSENAWRGSSRGRCRTGGSEYDRRGSRWGRCRTGTAPSARSRPKPLTCPFTCGRAERELPHWFRVKGLCGSPKGSRGSPMPTLATNNTPGQRVLSS